jgi:hypothetical protein
MNFNSRPGKRRQALEDIIREIFRREVAIFEQRTCFDFNISNRAEFFDQSSKRMERADGLESMRQDAGTPLEPSLLT